MDQSEESKADQIDNGDDQSAPASVEDMDQQPSSNDNDDKVVNIYLNSMAN